LQTQADFKVGIYFNAPFILVHDLFRKKECKALPEIVELLLGFDLVELLFDSFYFAENYSWS
jgi:hypothetical protein